MHVSIHSIFEISVQITRSMRRLLKFMATIDEDGMICSQ